MTIFFSQGLDQLPTSALLHIEMLKRHVKLNTEHEVTPEFITNMTPHYLAATEEAYLKGTAYMYYALLLLFGPRERLQEGIDLLKVSH